MIIVCPYCGRGDVDARDIYAAWYKRMTDKLERGGEAHTEALAEMLRVLGGVPWQLK
jgi:hypothetical protein